MDETSDTAHEVLLESEPVAGAEELMHHHHHEEEETTSPHLAWLNLELGLHDHHKRKLGGLQQTRV